MLIALGRRSSSASSRNNAACGTGAVANAVTKVGSTASSASRAAGLRSAGYAPLRHASIRRRAGSGSSNPAAARSVSSVTASCEKAGRAVSSSAS